MAGWPLRRKKQIERPVPPEVQQYYRAQQRERMGVAWLIAFLSLLISVVVLFGVFFGGRWAWRKITQGDKKQQTTVQTENTDEQKPTELPGDGSTDNQAQTDPTDRNAGASGSANTPSNTTQPVTGDTAQPNLVRTGPDLDL